MAPARNGDHEGPDERQEALAIFNRFLGSARNVQALPRWRARPQLWFQSREDEDQSLEAVKLRSKRLNIKLRKRIANWSVFFVLVQVLSSNTFFGVYMLNNLQHLEAPIMLAWMSSSVVEIIAIMGIVAVSLFPNKNRRGRETKPAKRSLSMDTSFDPE